MSSKNKETAPKEEQPIEETPVEEAPEAMVEEVSETDALRAELESAQNDLAAEKDKNLRLRAEYDNFRKRSARERDNIYADVKADTLKKLLPIFDNLERALRQETADEAYKKGFRRSASRRSRPSVRNLIPTSTTPSCTWKTPKRARARSCRSSRRASKWAIG